MSEETFAGHIQKQNPESLTRKWRDISIGVLFKVTQANEITTKYGPATILEMQTREGETMSVWAPDRLAKELRGGVYPRYVRSLGLTACKQDYNKSYYKYELL